jgi:hypothetical protein
MIIFPFVFVGVKLDLPHKRQNRVPKMIVGPTRDEVRGDWKRLNNEKLQCFYSSSNTVSLEWSRQRRLNGLSVWHAMGRTEVVKSTKLLMSQHNGISLIKIE